MVFSWIANLKRDIIIVRALRSEVRFEQAVFGEMGGQPSQGQRDRNQSTVGLKAARRVKGRGDRCRDGNGVE